MGQTAGFAAGLLFSDSLLVIRQRRMKLNHLHIAVSGSGGFVGVPLVRRLKELGANVLEIDHGQGADICDFEQVNKIGRFDALIHLAAKTFVPDSYENPRDFYATNLLGTLNALELCRIRKARMIFASSYVYGVPRFLPIDESHPVSGFNPYSGSKIAGEQLCERYQNDHGVQVAILRLFNIYGPGQNTKFLIPSIIEQAKKGKVFLKDPEPKRDFIYVADVVEAYVRVILYDDPGLSVFNIASGESFSVRDVVGEILKNFAEGVQVVFTGEERECEVPDTRADITKARNSLGWSPTVPFPEGIRACVEII
jgi:UDP-glucose 4-epimerase